MITGQLLLGGILKQWLPLAPTVLDMVCRKLPSPLDITAEAVNKLMYGAQGKQSFPQARTWGIACVNPSQETQALEEGVLKCDASASPIAFVSKLSAVPIANFPENQAAPPSQEEMQKKLESSAVT